MKEGDGGTTVLIVDDHAGMRKAARDILEGDGYWVTEASSGEEALLRPDLDSFDFVLTDLNMGVGHMSGLALGRTLKARAPAAKVFLMSDNTELVQNTETKQTVFEENNISGFVQKLRLVTELLKLLRS